MWLIAPYWLSQSIRQVRPTTTGTIITGSMKIGSTKRFRSDRVDQQQRQPEPEQELERDPDDDDEERVLERAPDAIVAEGVAEVVEPDERLSAAVAGSSARRRAGANRAADRC